MLDHNDLVMYIAARLEKAEQRKAARLGIVPDTIETLVDYRCKELDIQVTNQLGEITRIYEIKRHDHIGKAAGQLYSAREYFKYRQSLPIQLIYVSQWCDDKIRARIIR